MKDEAKKLLFGFLNPTLFGVYVLVGILAAIVFGIFYFGYGSWLRVGPFLGITALLFLVLILAVVSLGWLQTKVWSKIWEQPLINEIPWSELLLRALAVAAIILPLTAATGAKIREARVYQICRTCDILITGLENEKKRHGIYPSNARAFVTANPTLHHKYLFYYGVTDTNGVEWDPDTVAEANVSLFVTTNRFQVIVPIERMSPISFSSFYVYYCSSEHPFWNKTRLHWSLEGAYLDEPSEK